MELNVKKFKVTCLQDAIVFSGTVRSNLDPFQRAEGGDATIWQALERAGMKAAIEALPVRYLKFWICSFALEHSTLSTEQSDF